MNVLSASPGARTLDNLIKSQVLKGVLFVRKWMFTSVIVVAIYVAGCKKVVEICIRNW